MYKALMINMQDKYPVHELLEKKFVNFEFESDIDVAISKTTDYHIIVFYSHDVNINVIRKFRDACNFSNIRIIHFVDHDLNPDREKQVLHAGANLVEKLPEGLSTLFEHLTFFKTEFDEAKNYNENALKPFKQSISEIFATMAFLDLSFVDVYNAPGLFHFGEVAGIMDLGGKEIGSIVITMSDDLARKLISSILAIPSDELLISDIEDGVAELINMVAGGAKARITDEKQHFLLSSPSILTGKKSDQSLTNNSNSLILQYKVEDNYFAIEICLNSMHS